MATKDNKDKQFTELSEDELRQVTGGKAQFIEHSLDGAGAGLLDLNEIFLGQCPEDQKDKNGHCPQK